MGIEKITSEMIKILRERSGVGMSKCKDALVEADGDIEKAAEILRKKGLAAAVKKEGRETKEGVIGAYESSNEIGLIEVNSETDFVAKSDKFQKFVSELVSQITKTKPVNLQQFLKENYEIDPSLTIDEYRNLLIQSIGENIQISRILTIHKEKNTSYGIYSHMNGKIVTIAEIKGSDSEAKLAKDIAMHIAAEDPQYLKEDKVPQSVIEKEEEIARSQIKGKPEPVIEKIVAGKIKAFYDQVCLLNQKYVKDPNITIATLVQNRSKEIKKDLTLNCFWRWKVGESL